MVVNEPKLIEELCDKSVIQFYNGSAFVLALTSDKKLYGWGNNELGQLGINIINHKKLYKPVLIEDLNDIMIEQISCGSGHTLVLTTGGVIYGWGVNDNGQIGCGTELGDKISVIINLELLPRIKLVHCSYHKSFALTDNGMVYSWGRNEWCDLGHELNVKECVFKPKLIRNLSNITSICSSNTNTYFLSTNVGIIYFCGIYDDENNKKYFQLVPKLMLIFFKSETIFKSILRSNGSIYSKQIFKDRDSIAAMVCDDMGFELNFNKIKKTNFKTINEFYSKEY